MAALSGIPVERPWQIRNIVYLSDSTGVGNLGYSDKKSGLAFLNQNGQVEKELSLPGNVTEIGKWKGNILCIYINEFAGKPTKEIHAVLVDAKKRTVISDKLIYQNQGDIQLDLTPGKDDMGNFYYLLIRTTALAGDPGRFLSEKEEKKLGSTTALKDYFHQMKDNSELTKTKHFKDVEDLKPDGVVFIGDKLAVCNQIQYIYSMPQQGAATRFTSEGAVLSLYDKQLHLLHQFFLDMYYETFIDVGRGLSYHARDGKLLVFGNELAGIGSYQNFCYVLDLNKFSAEKKIPEWGNVMKSYPVDPRTVFWFDKSILKNHAAGNYFFGKHVDSYLVKTGY